jgi:hypothetical protein
MLMVLFYRNLTASNVRFPVFDTGQAGAAIMGAVGCFDEELRECTKF